MFFFKKKEIQYDKGNDLLATGNTIFKLSELFGSSFTRTLPIDESPATIDEMERSLVTNTQTTHQEQL